MFLSVLQILSAPGCFCRLTFFNDSEMKKLIAIVIFVAEFTVSNICVSCFNSVVFSIEEE